MNNDVELIPVKGVLPSVQVQSDNVIYVPQAHKNKAGIVKEGDGVLIENGVVSLNKQTVEDMIDANKWVSYGFRQNLTEDEKGMARHNIGAGDNYFTGSYYDLTQKPHLNTNNTTGLDYGDEELNDTINLHKISKTGSFNDLRHVPQETIDFAESERQKSKNLFDTTKAENVGYNWNGTLNSNNSSHYISCGFIKIKPNTNYIFSLADSTITMQYTGALFYTLDKTYISYVECNGNTFITPSNAEYMICQFWFESNPMNYKDIIQIEENSVATSFQKFNGQITHNGDAPVVFAESERQKSKNLFDLSDFDSNLTGNVSSTQTDQQITFTSTNPIAWFGYKVPVETGKQYTISVSDISYTTEGLFVGNSDVRDEFSYGKLTTSIKTLTLTTNSNYLYIKGYATYNTVGDAFTINKLQIEKGSVATEYQPYNGAIVHEEQIADVEHIETIYEMNTKNSIGGSPYTAGIPFSNISISNVDFNKYKYLRFTCRWNDHPSNWFGGTITFDLDLQTPYNSDLNYISVISNRPSSCCFYDAAKTFDLVGFVKVNIDKNVLNVIGYKITYTGEQTSYTSDNYLTYFRIEKIEGVY